MIPLCYVSSQNFEMNKNALPALSIAGCTLKSKMQMFERETSKRRRTLSIEESTASFQRISSLKQHLGIAFAQEQTTN